jgi:hypothetical protein
MTLSPQFIKKVFETVSCNKLYDRVKFMLIEKCAEHLLKELTEMHIGGHQN